ncbi:hypothetical protein V6N13_055838 [Hibiscus sabdariffa]
MRNCKATLSKRAMASVDTAVVDVWQREVGELSNRKFANRIRLENDQDLVDSARFNADGNLLVYGALSDKRIKIWDWEAGIAKLTFESGHVYINHYFVAKFMPNTGDRSWITCAEDGQVRHAQISDSGVKTRMVANHIAGAYDLAVETGSPHIFYSCGADGLVNHIDLRTAAATKLFKCQSIDARRLDFTPLYHMAVDPMNPNIFAVSGSDKHTLLYDIRKSKRDGSIDFGQPIDLFYPPHLIGDDRVGVIDLAFPDQNELLVAYNDTSVYLFTRDLGLGLDPFPSSPSSARREASEKIIPQVYKGHANYERKKSGELVHVIKADKRMVNFIESHPHTAALASGGSEDIKIWTPKAIDKAVTPTQIELDQQLQNRGRGRFEYFKRFIDDIQYISSGLELTSSDEE